MGNFPTYFSPFDVEPMLELDDVDEFDGRGMLVVVAVDVADGAEVIMRPFAVDVEVA